MASPATSSAKHIDENRSESSISSPSEVCLKDLGADETYEALKRSFLPKGRGRPPDPPVIPCVTNRLLLQLMLLKDEGSKTHKDVAGWFETLFPAVSYPSSRLSGLMDRLLKKMKSMSSKGLDLQSFLQTEIDLDFVSGSLMKFGLRRGDLLQEDIDSVGLNAHEAITHEVIVDLMNFSSRENLGDDFMFRWIRKLSVSWCNETDETLASSVKLMMSAYKTLIRKKGGIHDAKLAVFLSTVFVPNAAKKQACPQKSQSETDKVLSKTIKENQSLKEKQTALQDEIKILQNTIHDLSNELNDKMKLLTEVRSLREEICHLNHTVTTLKQKIRELQPYKLAQMKKKVADLRKTVRSNRALADNCSKLKGELAAVKIQAEQARQSFLRDGRRVRQKLRRERQNNERLLASMQELHKEIYLVNEHNIETRMKSQNNRFTDDIRKTVLQLQADANVPASKCASVISIVSRTLFGQNFEQKDLPCLQTALNIADEGHVLAKVQATERILEAQNTTLHTDGTSRDHKKIVSQQVTLDTGETLSFGFTSVASEDAATLLDMTIKQLEEMTDLYCQYKNTNMQETFKQILCKLTTFMTDRAAVMKKFNSDFLNFIRTETGTEAAVHFLYCNAHFLLGLSRACDVSLKQAEERLVQESGRRLGRDKFSKFAFFMKSTEVATSRIVWMAAHLTGPRGDEKNGCRVEWLAFCQEHHRKSMMISYKNNRFNAFFEGAATIIHHREDLSRFFKTLDHSNLKIESVAEDLEDERLMIFVCAAAVLFILVTGPYWELLQSQVKFTDFFRYIQPLKELLETCRDDASVLLDPDFMGAFGDEFQLKENKTELKDSVLIFAHLHAGEVIDVLQQLMPEMIKVLDRQLEDFLQGGVYGGPPAVFPDGLDHCPLTNLLGENVFGDLDFDISYRRNATTHQRSTTHMLSHNRTPDWLNKKNTEETSQLLQFARKKGRSLHQQHRQQEKLVMIKIREKLVENERKKLERDAKQAAVKADLIRRMMTHGGPCVTAADVDALVIRFRQERDSVLLNALKDQIRYQKTVLNSKGDLRLLGSIEDLVAQLKVHFDDGQPAENQPQDNQVEVPPPFSFENQGQWVAVYFHNQFYIGQVINVLDKDRAIVRYLEEASGTDRKDHFRYPSREDIAETSSDQVFQWDFDVNPASSSGRLWQVSGIEDIAVAYDTLKQGF